MKGKRTFQPNTRRRKRSARVPGAHEHKERPSGPETAPRQGPETSDGQQRIAFEVPPEPSGSAATPIFRTSTSTAPAFRAVTTRCSRSRTGSPSAGWELRRPSGSAARSSEIAPSVSSERFFVEMTSRPASISSSCRGVSCSSTSLTTLETDYRTFVTARILKSPLNCSPTGSRGAPAASRLQASCLTIFQRLLPVPAVVRGLYGGSHRTARRRCRHLARPSPAGSLSSTRAGRARPGAPLRTGR